jgi:hypothetical protein
VENFAEWGTKLEASEQLGYSDHTLERKIIKLKLRTVQRDVPGRHPITVLHPADFERLKAQVIPATPAPVTTDHGHALPPGSTLPPALREFAASLLGTLPYPRVYRVTVRMRQQVADALTHRIAGVQRYFSPALRRAASWRSSGAESL